MKTIKNLLFIAAIAATSISFGQVNRELTVDETKTTVTDANFQYHCEAAILRFAKTYSASDDVSVGQQIGVVGYTNWYKYHTFATGIMESGFVGSELVAKDFLLQLKGTNLWTSSVSPFNVSTLITYMETNPNKFDTAAELYVKLKTKSIRY